MKVSTESFSSAPVSNGVPRSEEDEDEDEQGEKFEFDDCYDGESETMSSETKSDRNPETAVSNVPETLEPEENGTSGTEPKGESPGRLR